MLTLNRIAEFVQSAVGSLDRAQGGVEAAEFRAQAGKPQEAPSRAPAEGEADARSRMDPPRPSSARPRRFSAPRPAFPASVGGSAQPRQFLQQAAATALLDTLEAFPRDSRASLGHTIQQLEDLRRSYALARATEGRVSALVNVLRDEIQRLPEAGRKDPEGEPRRSPLDAATAHALFQAVESLPRATRPEMDSASEQLVGLLRQYEIPGDLKQRGLKLLVAMEDGMAALPPTKEEAAAMAAMDAMVFTPGARVPSTSKADASPAAELARIGDLAGQPILHPQLREAAERVVAFVRVGEGGRLESVWGQPRLWALSDPEVRDSVFRQSVDLLARLTTGQRPAVQLVQQMFGNDPDRLKAFASDLAAIAQPGSDLHRLASHVRDNAMPIAGQPGVHVPPMPQGPGGPAPRRTTGRDQESWRRLVKAQGNLARARL